MARTGVKVIFFPAEDLSAAVEFIDKIKKKVGYLTMQISMKSGQIEVKLRGSKDNVVRAQQEIRGFYNDIVKSQRDLL
ncbi:MAG TPA: hypothetical protein VKK79_19990 [Candidatus Lokiarchaeia archaeon]|nr:hypothetical protein [Candidatus Lokiarchaeia archaeon]